MSTPNPTHIIAEHHGAFDDYRLMFVCRCGETWPALSDDYDTEIELHAAHVVSKLTDAGYSIVQLPKPEATHTLMSGKSYQTFPVWASDTPVFAFSDGDVTLDDVGDMTVDDARELGLALLAAAAAAEGEKL